MNSLKKILALMVVITIISPIMMYAGNWEAVNVPTDGTVCSMFNSSKDILYIGGTKGIKYSTDKGEAWIQISEPQVPNMHSIMKIKEDFSGAIYAVSTNGIYTSKNGISNWSRITDIVYTEDVSFDNNNGIYAVICYSGSEYHLIYNNGNGNWADITPVGKQITSMKCYPIKSDLILLNIGDKMLVSVNRGIDWYELPIINFTNIEITDNKYYAVDNNSDLYFSTSGMNWEKVAANPTNLKFKAVKNNPYTNVLFALTVENGLNISKDNGANWEELNSGIENIKNDITCISFNPNGYVYVSGGNSKMYRLDMGSLSVKESEKDDVNIYPNPSIGTVSIPNSSNCTINIYDESGRLLQTYYTSDESNNMYNLETLNSGKYYISIINSQGTITKGLTISK